MYDDCLEVLDADDDMESGLNIELLEIGSVDGNSSHERMLQDLFAVCDLLRIALENSASVFTCKDVQHLRLRAKEFDVFLHGACVHTPPISRHVAVEQSMHDIHSFVCKLVGFDDALVAHHLNKQATLRLVVAVLDAHLTPVDRAISAQWVIKTSFENRKKSFGVHAAGEAPVWAAVARYALIAGEELLAVESQSSVGGF